MAYKIFPRIAIEDEDLARPLDVSVVDLLTDRKDGCHLYAVVEPKTEVHRKLRERGRLVLAKLALNYGPSGNLSAMYYVFLNSQEAMDGKGPVFVLDNVYDEKKFMILPEEATGIWREGDKVSNRFTLVGDISSVFDELRSAGFSFSGEKPDIRGQGRVEKIKERLKENGIYHFQFNPNV